MYEPVIKWSGSKRSQAREILEYFPSEIGVYYEPFCGGASVLRRLLDSDIKVKEYICSDINEDLINLWLKIKHNPQEVIDHYTCLWNELNVDDDKARKKGYFEDIRRRYNKEHNPLDFMFIMRTTTNGMPRYNQKGEFNNSFHITRNGIIPNKLNKIVKEWSYLLLKYDVQFMYQDYEEIKGNVSDFLYLDPPYANTKGMYMGNFDNKRFFKWLSEQDSAYILSYDGISGDVNNTYNVPSELYTEHKYLRSGNSSFKRTIGKSTDSIVYESIYIKEVRKE